MSQQLLRALEAEDIDHGRYRLLLRSLGSDAAILSGIAEAGSVRKLLRNLGLSEERRFRGHH